jgi:hypothetical protein
MFAEATFFTADALGLDCEAEGVVERASQVRWRRIRKGGPPAPPDVAVERELTDAECGTPCFLEGEIHLALWVFEDAQACYAGGQGCGCLLLVTVAHAEEDQQPRPNLTDGFAVHGDCRPSDPLDYGPHFGGLTSAYPAAVASALSDAVGGGDAASLDEPFGLAVAAEDLFLLSVA